MRKQLIEDAVHEMLSKIRDMQIGQPMTRDEWREILYQVLSKLGMS